MPRLQPSPPVIPQLVAEAPPPARWRDGRRTYGDLHRAAIAEALRVCGGNRRATHRMLVAAWKDDAPSEATIQRVATEAGIDCALPLYTARQRKAVLDRIRRLRETAKAAGEAVGVPPGRAAGWAREAGLDLSKNKGRWQRERGRQRAEPLLRLLRAGPAAPTGRIGESLGYNARTACKVARDAGLGVEARHRRRVPRVPLPVVRRALDLRLTLTAGGRRMPWPLVAERMEAETGRRRTGGAWRMLVRQHAHRFGYEWDEVARRQPTTLEPVSYHEHMRTRAA